MSGLLNRADVTRIYVCTDSGREGEYIYRLVEQMAAAIGVAFQIQDDILDVTSSMEVLGKPVLSDEKNNKTTYVTLEGLEKAKKDVARISDDAVRILHELPGENEFLEALIHMLVSREK